MTDPQTSATLSPFAISALGAVGAACLAAFTGAVAFIRYLLEQSHASATFQNALHAELKNVHEHCYYASHEMPGEPHDLFELRLRLVWGQHAPLRTANDISKLGYIERDSVRELIQLELKMRNDNSYADRLIAGIDAEKQTLPTPAQLAYLKQRLDSRMREADHLIEELERQKPTGLVSRVARWGSFQTLG